MIGYSMSNLENLVILVMPVDESDGCHRVVVTSRTELIAREKPRPSLRSGAFYWHDTARGRLLTLPGMPPQSPSQRRRPEPPRSPRDGSDSQADQA